MTTPSPIIESITKFDGEYGMGYRFIMNDISQNITCKMQNDRQCCERFGVYTDSKMDDFIGSSFISFEIGKPLYDHENGNGDSSMITIEAHIHTSKGKITIRFFNEHNGYYTHDVLIHSKTINQIIRI